MKAPFPWFGGKRRVSPEIWAALGDVANYVEPFAGSLAVLLERPAYHSGWRNGAETVNDLDAYLANLWRAIQAAPDEVARFADWPVNETDLVSRHLWLVSHGRERIASMEADPGFCDPQVAGWWLWGQCAWIGSGWCSGRGPWAVADGQVVDAGDAGRGVNRQLPHLGDAGLGVNRKLPHLGDAGRGVNRQLPHLGDAGRGAAQGSDMTHGGSGAPSASWDQSLWHKGEEHLVYGYMRALAARVRRVRVCCGDWRRVLTDGAMSYGATVGVLLDPPYDDECRTRGLYSEDGGSLSADVRAWAIEHGDDPRMRIALCGYEGEHAMPDEWSVHAWKSSGAYKGSSGADGVCEVNRHRERIWFSPHCLTTPKQADMWGRP